MQPTNDAVSESFHLLDTTVRSINASGRRCLAAKLKPELQRRSKLAFSEQVLGFAKFADFLKDAQRAGIVRLERTLGGDWEVLPALQSTPPFSRMAVGQPESVVARPALRTNPPSPHESAVRVRDDLWAAFNSSSAQWVYDKNTDSARRIPGHASSEVGPELVGIPPGGDRVLGWMRSFAEAQSPSTKAQLASLLLGASPAYRFRISVNANPNVGRAWRRYHVQQVVAAIDAWAASNNVHPKAITGPFNPVHSVYSRPVRPAIAAPVVPSAPPVPAPPLAISLPSTPSSALTPRLEALITEMIDQLLLLRGTLQVLGPRG
jgi:hypothetical protein